MLWVVCGDVEDRWFTTNGCRGMCRIRREGGLCVLFAVGLLRG